MMKTEIDLAQELSASGWVGEVSSYELSHEQLDELLAVYGFLNHPLSAEFGTAINRTVSRFCYGVERYYAHTKLDDQGAMKPKPQKITTDLRKLCDSFSKQSQKLLNITNEFESQEIDWLFADSFQNGFHEANKCFDDMVRLLSWFQRLAEQVEIEVKTSTVSLVGELTRRCINIVEHYAGIKVAIEVDPMSGKDESTFSNFMITLWAHIPEDIKSKLTQKPSSFESVIRAAIAENKRLMEAEGLYKLLR